MATNTTLPHDGATDATKIEHDHLESLGRKHATNNSEKAISIEDNLVYDDAEEEPEIHVRTWVAVAAMFLLNLVQILALLGPPVVLDNIGESLHDTARQTWVPNALSLVQAVFAPVISSASDTFQARKFILVISSTISFIGCAIAPGSKDVGRLIAAQTLIGVGFSSTALAYCVPSEILPRKWRPLIQAFINVAAGLGACAGPLIIGALTQRDPVNGWRDYYWIQMAFWGVTAICIFVGYRPPKRHTRYDHLSLFQKIGALDLPGVFLFAAGLTLFLVGLNLGGNLFEWTDRRVLATLIVGIITLLGFGIYEWLGTKTGMAHHDMFRGAKRTGLSFAIFLILIFIEGILLFAYIIFYPVLTTNLYEKDLFLLAAREQPFWIAGGIATVCWGFWSMRAKSIRVPLAAGFLVSTAGMAAFATLQPGDSTRACIFSGLAGIGLGAPLVLIIAGIQLGTPHALIATATSLAISCRAVAAAAFTAIYSAALSERLESKLPSYVAKAAMMAGLPATSVQAFVGSLLNEDMAALAQVPGVTPAIVAAATSAVKQAFADSLRVVFIIAAPFGLLGCFLCLFLADQSETMTYRVDAPIEDLHARHHHHSNTTQA